MLMLWWLLGVDTVDQWEESRGANCEQDLRKRSPIGFEETARPSNVLFSDEGFTLK
jgi:hypothetical protein